MTTTVFNNITARVDLFVHADDKVLASVADLTQLVKEMKMGVAESFQALSTEVDAIIADIADLKAQIAAGSPVTAQQLDDLTSKLKEGA